MVLKNNINTAVIMCGWNRPERFQFTINMLLSQTDQDFDFYVWNNNKTNKNYLNNIINQNKDKITINITHSDKNIGGIGRFYLAKKIYSQHKKIIFIDDDQIFENNLINEMKERWKEKTITSWWGWKIKNHYFKRQRILDGGEVDYCGTGGLIMDGSIFKTLKLNTIPPKYSFIEDLWLSYVSKYEYGYKLYGYKFPINIEKDGKDQVYNPNMLKLKNEFYIYLKRKYFPKK